MKKYLEWFLFEKYGPNDTNQKSKDWKFPTEIVSIRNFLNEEEKGLGEKYDAEYLYAFMGIMSQTWAEWQGLA